MSSTSDHVLTFDNVSERLHRAGCIAFEEEAGELIEAHGEDPALLERMVNRRCSGEPLAWLVGAAAFCGLRVLVHAGVYVPRWQSEPLALEAVERLPVDGLAIDLCTGSGAIALVLQEHKPEATVRGCELDPRAARCARANGVRLFEGDMAWAIPRRLYGHVDVVTAVVPYVPTEELHLLPRDVTAFEPLLAIDGGQDGLTVLRKTATIAALLLRSGGWLFLEVGGDQDQLLQHTLSELGFASITRRLDDDGDIRALVCRR